jgi:hypothetical protein
MKILPLLLTIGFITPLRAQSSEKYIQAMQKMLAKTETAQAVEDWQNASNGFERIALVEKQEWLAWYYAAYSNIMGSFVQPELGLVDAILDKADKHLARAEALLVEGSPAVNQAEVLVLKSLAASARIRVDFSRGMQYGPAASGYASRAAQLDASNPRAWMQQGQQLLFTPEAFGGGPAKGCPLLKKAQEHFEAFVPASSIDPNWGAAYNSVLIKESCSGYRKD